MSDHPLPPQKVALITGASSGFGLLCSIELARAGYRVIATMRDLSRRERLDAAIAQATASTPALAGWFHIEQLDVCDFSALPAFVAGTAERHGRIDLLLNNAGFAVSGFVEDVSLAELRGQLETNLFGQVALTQAVLPMMRRQRSGHIIMMSSISGRVAQPGVGSYSTSKFALEAWSEALRIEALPLGIKVVLVEPGSFDTDIWTRNVTVARKALSADSPNHERSRRFAKHVKSMGKRADPREVARLIVRIAQDPNPRLRYIIGRKAHLYYWLRLLLPWKIYERWLAGYLGID